MEKMHRKNADQCNAFFRKFLATIVHLSRAYRRNSIATAAGVKERNATTIMTIHILSNDNHFSDC